jgi:hypothetical protein
MSRRPRAETPESRVCSPDNVPVEHGRGSGWPCCDNDASPRHSERDPGRSEVVPSGTRTVSTQVVQDVPLRKQRSSGRRAGAKARADPRSVWENAPGRPKGCWLRCSCMSCDLFADRHGRTFQASTMWSKCRWQRSRFCGVETFGSIAAGPGQDARKRVLQANVAVEAAHGVRHGHGPQSTIEPVRRDGQPTTNRSRIPARAFTGFACERSGADGVRVFRSGAFAFGRR